MAYIRAGERGSLCMVSDLYCPANIEAAPPHAHTHTHTRPAEPTERPMLSPWTGYPRGDCVKERGGEPVSDYLLLRPI